MEQTGHTIRHANGDTAAIIQSADGTFLCPVCAGATLQRLPYDAETGAPSFERCGDCDTQFGWDDKIAPDAPRGALDRKWTELREDWLRDDAPGDVADRLRALGIDA